MSTVISVEHLSKSYRLGTIGGGTLHGDLSRWWARVRQKPDPNSKIGEEHHVRHIDEEFWALQDVNFEVEEGEILGIIGRNGAGKSTLLKILSRVTGPTSGYVKIKGRIASLLEVGTGFHPELTGRENVFLNGTILGMTKSEIRRKFDEIVAFSEIEEFIDTPVKRYSSGMYVRLAFAVAAHLEPEILIVDEVLAVGDAQFQKKCLGKMKDVAKGGRTVLFVSHAMETIQRLCKRVILLHKGQVTRSGPPAETINFYFRQTNKQAAQIDLRERKREDYSRGGIRLLSVELEKGETGSWTILSGDPLGFIFTIEVLSPVGSIEVGIALHNANGAEIVSSLSSHAQVIQPSSAGVYKVTYRYTHLALVPGPYHFGVGIRSERGLEDYLPEAFSLEIIPSDYSARLHIDTFRGSVVPTIEVELKQV